MKSAAVIGAGAAGLATARYLAAHKGLFKTVIYEQESQIGGTWLYAEQSITAKPGSEGMDELLKPDNHHSSMYKSLRTNLPKQVMAYPDFPFSDDCRTFPSHVEVLKYLQDYASNYGIYDAIRFNQKVTNVMPMPRENAKDHHDNVQWVVKSIDTKDGLESTEIYDTVIICNGHFTVPNVPVIQGIENYKGFVMHSHFYRVPDAYANKDVVVLGARSSGRDISIEISRIANSVMLSHRNEKVKTSMPENISEKPSIKSIDNDGCVVFEDESRAKADAIVFCTGYKFNLPFLDEKCRIKVENERVFPLYKQIFNAHYPSMAFVGLQNIVCPCKLFSMQAEWITNVLAGKLRLPTSNEMLEDSDIEFKKKTSIGYPEKFFHRMEKDLQWEYYNMISKEGNVKPIKTAIEKLYKHVASERDKNLLHYRDIEYRVLNDEEFEKI
eukprot:gene18864-20764_t